MEMNEINHAGSWKGLMVGSILGGAAGFLLVPKSGKELRSGIKGKTDKVLEETKRLSSDSRTRFENALSFVSGRRERASLREIESPEEILGDS